MKRYYGVPREYDIKQGRYVHFEPDEKGNVKVTQNNDPDFLNKKTREKLGKWKWEKK
jgi:hypothetical protein